MHLKSYILNIYSYIYIAPIQHHPKLDSIYLTEHDLSVLFSIAACVSLSQRN